MVNSRYLLLLFGFTFLLIQVLSFISSARDHETELAKLDKLVIQVENGSFFDLRIDPQNAVIMEKKEFRKNTLGFVLKVVLIISITLFVFRLVTRMARK